MIRKILSGLFLLSALCSPGFVQPLAHATVNEGTAAARYTANGTTTAFTYTFKILSKLDIEVLVDTTVKTVDVDYLVSGVSSATGGTVTFLSAPANATTITLLRKQPASQLSTYFPNEPFPSQRVEKDFDRLVMSVQQLKEQFDRTVTFAKSSSLTGQTMDTPVVGMFARAKVGGGIDWASVSSGSGVTLPVSIANGGTGATTAASALNNLGASATTPLDSVFRVVGSGNPSKRLAFEVDGFTAGATRTITFPDANLAFPAITASGQLPIASTSGVLTTLPVGAAGTVPMSRTASATKLAYVAPFGKTIYGLTYANNTGDAVNDIDIAAGGAMDATGAYWLQLPAITKRLDAMWAVGTNQGGMDAAFPASTVMMTIASPAVVSWTSHGLVAGDTVIFTTTGALPTGVTAGTKYFIIAAGLTSNAFEFSTTAGGAAVNTSGSQSGVHTATGFYSRDYYLWTIGRSDTGVVDALFSLSSTAPTMPANYDFKRLMGWIKRVDGAIVAFHTYETEGGGIELLWESPTLDIDLTNTLTTARRTDAVKVPLNFSTIAILNVRVADASTVAENWIYCPDQTDLAPSPTAAPLGNIVTSASGVEHVIRVRTSDTGTIAARSNLATVDSYRVATIGFTWARRN